MKTKVLTLPEMIARAERERLEEQMRSIRARANALQQSIAERGWTIASSVGISRCGCILHNASIDDSMTGWCKGNPDRLKKAKLATLIHSQSWIANRLADRLIARLLNRIHGAKWYDDSPTVQKANPHVVFVRLPSRLP